VTSPAYDRAAYERTRRDAATAAGLCRQCLKRPARAHRRVCEPCTEAAAERKRRQAGTVVRVVRAPRERAAHRTFACEPHVPGLSVYNCAGYGRPRNAHGDRSHRVTQIWIPERLCLECMARKDADDGYVPAVLTVEQDRADEMLALSYGAIAARGR
jgi:hypothetical protein